MRNTVINAGFLKNGNPSVLIEAGKTRVLCAATVAEEVPSWMRKQKLAGGWITAEYQMLPASTPGGRTRRERGKNIIGGRTQEIQRLIGRSLRASTDLIKLGPRTITVDCDVLEADGGTRCASITGGMVALAVAAEQLVSSGVIPENPVISLVAALSVGMVEGDLVLDLSYEQDVKADVDANIVMTESGEFVEVQASAEGAQFSREELDGMLDLASKGISGLIDLQRKTIGD